MTGVRVGVLAVLLAAPAWAAAGVPTVVSVTVGPNVAQDPAVLARDGTYSAVIAGRSYWVFGDTALSGYNAAGENFFSNSASWSTALSAPGGIVLDGNDTDASGLPDQVIPFTAREAHFNAEHAGSFSSCAVQPCGENLGLWSGSIAQDPASGTVYVTFAEIVRGGDITGFKVLGGGIAPGRILPNGQLRLARAVESSGTNPYLMWNGKQTIFSDQSFFWNGYYYVYATQKVWITDHDILARVPAAEVLNNAAWTYYAGNGVWSADEAQAVTLFKGSAAGSSVFYDAYLKCWLAVFSQNFSNAIYYAAAHAPWGPWSAPVLLYTGLPGWQGNADYAARAHPEYSPDGGRTIAVTYVHDTGFLRQDLPTLWVVFAPAG